MKNIFSLFLSALLLCSCWDGFEDDKEQLGFNFEINNDTLIEYTNAEITIGTIKEGEFVASETLKLATLPKSSNIGGSTFYFLSGDRWQPDLESIEKAYFKLKLNEERNDLIRYNFRTDEAMYLNIPSDKVISNRGENSISRISFVIDEDIVFGAGNNIP